MLIIGIGCIPDIECVKKDENFENGGNVMS